MRKTLKIQKPGSRETDKAAPCLAQWERAGRAGVLCLAGIVAVACTATRFAGDGPLIDHGFFSYPRYEAPVGQLRFATEGTSVFKLSGLPTGRMTLQLRVPGYSSSNRQALESLTTRIGMKILDRRGDVICAAEGSPSSRDDAKWIVQSSKGGAALWHLVGRDIPVSPRMDYTLQVSITNVDPNTPDVVLHAALVGGGSEMP